MNRIAAVAIIIAVVIASIAFGSAAVHTVNESFSLVLCVFGGVTLAGAIVFALARFTR